MWIDKWLRKDYLEGTGKLKKLNEMVKKRKEEQMKHLLDFIRQAWAQKEFIGYMKHHGFKCPCCGKLYEQLDRYGWNCKQCDSFLNGLGIAYFNRTITW